MTKETLKVENLSKAFGGAHVLEGIFFSVKAGECVAIIGPNGAGKTTLLNLVSGELQPTSGIIYLFGQMATNQSVQHRVRLGLGRCFQINSLFHGLTVLDNLLLALKSSQSHYFQVFRPMTTYTNLLVEAKQLLGFIGLQEKKNVLISDLSYGEQRRLEVALGLATRPKLLLLDEPSAGLSSNEEITSLVNILSGLTKDISIVFVAHDMDLVFRLAHRVIVLYYGQIIAQGTPDEIQVNPKVQEIYLGVQEE